MRVHVLKANISLLVLDSISDVFRNGLVHQVEQPSTDEKKQGRRKETRNMEEGTTSWLEEFAF